MRDCGHNAAIADYMFCTRTHVISYKGCARCRMPWTKVVKRAKLSKKFCEDRDRRIQQMEAYDYVPTGNAWRSESVQADTDS